MEQCVHDVAEKIRSSGARLVFVGLGAPKQEYFIDALSRRMGQMKNVLASGGRMENGEWRMERKNGGRKKLLNSQFSIHNSLVLMSVGGSFDMIAGRTPRAPHAFQAVHLEWLWRLFREPWRWKRQRALVAFLYLVFARAVHDMMRKSSVNTIAL